MSHDFSTQQRNSVGKALAWSCHRNKRDFAASLFAEYFFTMRAERKNRSYPSPTLSNNEPPSLLIALVSAKKNSYTEITVIGNEQKEIKTEKKNYIM